MLPVEHACSPQESLYVALLWVWLARLLHVVAAMASAMVDVGSTALEDTTIVDQFKPRLPRPARPPSVNVISLKELDIGEPVEPKTKLYRSVWNPANGKPTPVAVKLVGKLEKDEVTVLDMLQVFHFTMEKGPIQRSSYVLVVGGSKVSYGLPGFIERFKVQRNTDIVNIKLNSNTCVFFLSLHTTIIYLVSHGAC